MKLSFDWTWHARRSGGLFLGVRLHFPTCVLFDDKIVRDVYGLRIGLIVATVGIELGVRERKLPEHGWGTSDASAATGTQKADGERTVRAPFPHQNE